MFVLSVCFLVCFVIVASQLVHLLHCCERCVSLNNDVVVDGMGERAREGEKGEGKKERERESSTCVLFFYQ